MRHTDTEHPHLHILYNQVKYDRKLVSDNNERRRSTKACKEIKQEYRLTFSKGKENVKAKRLHAPDKIKYKIYEAIKVALPGCVSLSKLADKLRDKGIEMAFIHRGNNPEKEIQGQTFTMQRQTLKASQIDRKYNYAKLAAETEKNRFVADTVASVRL